MNDQSCDDCAFAEGWIEPHGERVAICNHRERDEALWGEGENEDEADNRCEWFCDREALSNGRGSRPAAHH